MAEAISLPTDAIGVTNEQIRLYAIARIAVPSETRIRTIAEPASGGILYTLELQTLHRGRSKRWLAIHSNVLRGGIPDGTIAEEIRRAL